MEIKTKLDIGDKLYIIKEQSAYKKEICPMCDGEGFVYLTSPLNTNKPDWNDKMRCPNCSGNKIVRGDKVSAFSYEEKVIVGFKISVKEKSGVHISYRVKEDNHEGERSYPEYSNMIFTSEEDARAACEYLNLCKDMDEYGKWLLEKEGAK